MDYLTLVNSFGHWLKSWLKALIDSFPPYHRVEGLLEAKEVNPEGKLCISVGSVGIEVDRTTFDVLVVGERLRVLYTRRRRAITVDRLLPGKGPG